MFRKNLPMWERVMRAVAGLVMFYFAWQGAGWLSYLLWAGGGIALMTSMMAYCPACELMGRCPLETKQ